MLRAGFLLAAVIGLAQTAPPDHTAVFSAPKAANAPAPDLNFSSAAWSTALTAQSFEDFTTREPAKFGTLAYFLYDDKNLYVGFHAAQSGTPIVATQAVDNAGVLSDDHVTFSVDTSGNGSRIYYFRATPKGVHDESSSENARYAPSWTSLAKVAPNGDYDVEMIIPIADIRLQSAPVQRWRINFIRYIAATHDEYTWAYESAEPDPSNAAFWPALDDIKLTASATRPQPRADVYALGATGYAHPRTSGVDFSYPLTGTLSAVGTLNPDFSNVEQDQTTIAPQMFQRMYSEYRPFFAQGANYINSMPSINVNGLVDTMFYTPSIGVFDRGFKVEGTAGDNSLGALNVKGYDLAGNALDDTAVGYSHNNKSQTFAFGGEGVFADHTGMKDDTAGVFLQQNNPRSGEFSFVRLADEQNSIFGRGHDLMAIEGFQTASYVAGIDYRDISATYNPLDGYNALGDIRGPRFTFQYNGVGGKSGAIKSWFAGGLVDRMLGSTGAVTDADVNGSIGVTFKNNLSLSLGAGPSELLVPGTQTTVNYALDSVQAGYNDGSPTPIDASYSWGPFGGSYLQQATISTTRRFGLYGLSLEYDGTVEHAGAAQPSTSTQWVRRVSLTRSFGKDASVAVGFRNINGLGGFALMPLGIDQTTNLAASFHQRFHNLDELFVEYGSPAVQNNTVHRVIAKYVFHVGSGSGT